MSHTTREQWIGLGIVGLFLLIVFGIGAIQVFEQRAHDPAKDRPEDHLDDARIIDGDTIHGMVGEHWEQVRFLGVDTPETTQETAPSEWEGVTSGECLREYGLDAKQKVTAFIENRDDVTVEMDPESDRYGYYDRLLGYVKADGENLNYWLVENGYARYYESNFSQSERFAQAEQSARQNGVGAWSCP